MTVFLPHLNGRPLQWSLEIFFYSVLKHDFVTLATVSAFVSAHMSTHTQTHINLPGNDHVHASRGHTHTQLGGEESVRQMCDQIILFFPTNSVSSTLYLGLSRGICACVHVWYFLQFFVCLL